MADNRVIIKINYDKDKYRKALIDPKMVTVWHTGRILAAVLIFFILIAFAVYLIEFAGSDQPAPQPFPGETAIEDSQSSHSLKVVSNPSSPDKTVGVRDETSDNALSEKVSKPDAIIFDRRVIRASLNTALLKGEPLKPVDVYRFVPEPGKTLELFYFCEVRQLAKQTLYHAWYKNGRLVIKKRVDIKSDKFKLVSSHKFTVEDVGEWRVALIDADGKLFSEVNFLVNH